MYRTSPAFSLPQTQRKVFVNELDSSPGPMYNTFGLGKRHQSLSHGIGKSARTQINHGVQKTPGPVQYNPQKIQFKKKVTIPKSQWTQKIDIEVPEPGFYEPNHKVGKPSSKVFAMTSRYPSIMDDNRNLPGPGAYQTMYSMKSKSMGNLKSLKSTPFNTTATRFKQSNGNPGPGQYDLLSQENLLSPDRKGKFKADQRFPPESQYIPGPGEYQLSSKIDQAIKYKMGKTLSGRPKKSPFLLTQTVTEGAFGKYEVSESMKQVKRNSAAFKIGNSQRKVFEVDPSPGPLDYIKENFRPKNTFRATIPNLGRDEPILNQNPGPGAYESPSNKATTYTIPRAQSSKVLASNPSEKVKNPGPGRYDIDKKAMSRTTKGVKFFSSSRTNFLSKNTAGVGDYDIEHKKSDNITIPKSARFGNRQDTKPGPGDYHIPSSIGKYNHYGKAKY